MLYDCVIIGAGPGGLQAAIYLGRYNRKTLLIHNGGMRTYMAAHMENILGQESISGKKLIEEGLTQVRKFNVEILRSKVIKLVKSKDVFITYTFGAEIKSKFVIVATGILDKFPKIGNIHEFLGRTFHTCIACDGYRALGKKVIIIGNDNKVAILALAIKQQYTKDIAICIEKKDRIKRFYLRRLNRENIKIIESDITRFLGKNGQIEGVILQNSEVVKCDAVFTALGWERTDTFLTEIINLKRDAEGYIKVDKNYETSVKGLFAVGPINTGPDQVIVAAGEGGVAAITVNNYLYDF